MKLPIRITISLDHDIADIIGEMRQKLKVSQSELIRRAIKFFYKYKDPLNKITFDQLSTYLDMLPEGEHIILDVDHWLAFLRFVNNTEEFWELHEDVAKAHAETLSKKFNNPINILKRLETCNFYKLSSESAENHTLILSSDYPKKFLIVFLQKVITAMGYNIEIKDDIAKLRVKIIKK